MIRCRHRLPRSLYSSTLIFSIPLIHSLLLLLFSWPVSSTIFLLWPHKSLFEPRIFCFFTRDLQSHFGATSAVSLHRDSGLTHASLFQVINLYFWFTNRPVPRNGVSRRIRHVLHPKKKQVFNCGGTGCFLHREIASTHASLFQTTFRSNVHNDIRVAVNGIS